MEKFSALPETKQKDIIDGAMKIFGNAPYKKASANDIAKAAGISKGMVFYYFGCKKDLYLFLANYAAQKVVDAYLANECSENPDFFERVSQTVEVKLGVLKEYPYMLRFLTSFFLERDPQVRGDIDMFLSDENELRKTIAFPKLDESKFKPGISPHVVMNLISRYTEGYISGLGEAENMDLDMMLSEFNECLTMMKNHFYKEEYL